MLDRADARPSGVGRSDCRSDTNCLLIFLDRKNGRPDDLSEAVIGELSQRKHSYWLAITALPSYCSLAIVSPALMKRLFVAGTAAFVAWTLDWWPS
jgi:hypothetical protein